MTTTEAAKRLEVSVRRVMALLYEDRFPGAQKIGNLWQIPVASVAALEKERAGGKNAGTR